ncbi:hypothetical protein [Nonomuraea salmonea]|uniref:hypothetical protein n=1 Tax=Nonomuraea salmonea TaxID=46181 RepID=UPI002FEBDB95
MKRAAAIAFVVLASAACAAAEEPAASADPPREPATVTATAEPTSERSAATPSPTAPPAFTSKVSRVSRDRLPYSWRSRVPRSLPRPAAGDAVVLGVRRQAAHR